MNVNSQKKYFSPDCEWVHTQFPFAMCWKTVIHELLISKTSQNYLNINGIMEMYGL